MRIEPLADATAAQKRQVSTIVYKVQRSLLRYETSFQFADNRANYVLGPWAFNFGLVYEQTTVFQNAAAPFVNVEDKLEAKTDVLRRRFRHGHNFAAVPVNTFVGNVTSGNLAPMIPNFRNYDEDEQASILRCFGLVGNDED